MPRPWLYRVEDDEDVPTYEEEPIEDDEEWPSTEPLDDWMNEVQHETTLEGE